MYIYTEGGGGGEEERDARPADYFLNRYQYGTATPQLGKLSNM